MLSARVLSIEEFFLLGVFSPASVQRDYVWDAQQSDELFNDIARACARLGDAPEDDDQDRVSIADAEIEAEADEAAASNVEDSGDEVTPGYHLGGVVLRRLGNSQFEIFDGLQRATTLTILLCLIRDLTTSEYLRSKIDYLIKSDNTLRIALPGVDQTLRDEIQASGQALKKPRRAAKGARGSRIRLSRSLFHSYLKNWDQDRLSHFADFVLKRTLLVVAETEYRTLARQVFITANHRGVTLGRIDIFRSQLLDIAGADQAAKTIASRWTGILQIAGGDIAEFMQAFDFIKRRDSQGADHLAKLADFIEKHYGPERILEVMDEILDYASAWVDLRIKLATAPSSSVDFDIWKLNFFQWFEWKPLALAFFKECRERRGRKEGGTGTKAKTAFNNRFAALHRACMLITLAQYSAVDRERIFRRALSQHDPYSAKDKSKGALTFTPRAIDRVWETLATPLYDDEIRKSLLRWTEACLHSVESLPAELARASTEHVLPRHPEPGSQWLKDFSDDDERFSACHSIGNLAILDYPENEKISNRDFARKLETIRAQAAKYKTLGDIAGETTWTREIIALRAGRMMEFICATLKIAPPLEHQPHPSNAAGSA